MPAVVVVDAHCRVFSALSVGVRLMFSFRAGQWDQTLSCRCHGDGAALELPSPLRGRCADRTLFLFSRMIEYELPGDSRAELELIVASSRILRPDSSDAARGWKVLALGLGLGLGLGLVLAIRLTVFPAPSWRESPLRGDG
jgi:hypothetical protein